MVSVKMPLISVSAMSRRVFRCGLQRTALSHFGTNATRDAMVDAFGQLISAYSQWCLVQPVATYLRFFSIDEPARTAGSGKNRFLVADV